MITSPYPGLGCVPTLTDTAVHDLMTSVSSIETITPHPLPSLPPSPSSEEDLSRAQVWQDDTNSHHQPSHTAAKGKQKQTRENYRDNGSDEALGSPEESGAYPPTNDDQTETRRVEEVSFAGQKYQVPLLSHAANRIFDDGKLPSV